MSIGSMKYIGTKVVTAHWQPERVSDAHAYRIGGIEIVDDSAGTRSQTVTTLKQEWGPLPVATITVK